MSNLMESNASFRSIIPIQVRFSDVDMLGHVSNTVYQNYYDAGKVHYFDEVLPEIDFVTIGLVGASIKIDYLKPIYMRTKILVETHVTHVGYKSLTMGHQLVERKPARCYRPVRLFWCAPTLKIRLACQYPKAGS